MGFQHYKIDIANPSKGEVTLKENVIVFGKKHTVLYVKKGSEVTVTFKYINEKKNTIDNSSEINWIFVTRSNEGNWNEVGWQANTGLHLQKNGTNYEYIQSQSIKIVGHSNYNLGRFYWLEPFFKEPEFLDTQKPNGILIVFYDNPQIIDASFKLIKKTHLYGNVIKLNIKTHLIPNPLMKGYNFGQFKVNIFSKRTGKSVTEEPLIFYQNVESDYALSSINELNFYINEKWKIAGGHPKGTIEEYYAVIEAKLLYNTNSEKIAPQEENRNQPTTMQDVDWKQVDAHFKGDRTTSEELPNGEKVLVKYNVDVEELRKLNDTPSYLMREDLQRKISKTFWSIKCEEFTTKDNFDVHFQTQADIISNRRDIVSNKIQYIGDITYTKKEFDPCGYSQIEVMESGGKPFTIFDEEKKGKEMDLTSQTFDVIAGDEKVKNIEIYLENHKTEACTGVMLESGKHTDKYNVFQMKNLILPSKNKWGQYERIKDDTHKDQLKQAGIKITTENSSDTDYKADPSKKVNNIDEVQGLTEGVDYKCLSNNKLQLGLKFHYNRTISQDITKFKAAEIIDNVWRFRYFLLTEDVSQKYFIPIGSCRYPHQQVKVRVFPDIKWEVYVLISPKNSLESVSHTRMPTDKDSFGDFMVIDEKGKKVKKDIYSIYQKKALEAKSWAKEYDKSYTGEFHIKGAVNGSSNTIDLGVGIQDLLSKALNIMVSAKDILDQISHRNSARGKAPVAMEKMKDLASSASIKSSLPVFLEFSLPTVKLGGGWNYEKIDNIAKCIGYLQFGFEPFVQAKGGIDLVAAVELIPPVRPILEALKYVKIGAQWMSENTPVKLEAELIFNLYAKGRVDIRGIFEFHNRMYPRSEVKASLLFGIELGFKIKASIEQVIFVSADDKVIKKVGLEGQLSAEAESGFAFTGTFGFSKEEGTYFQGKLDFTGLSLKLVGKFTIYRTKGGPKNYNLNNKFHVIDARPDILKTQKIPLF